MEKATEDFITLYKKDKITVKPIDEDISINNKIININLGNFTNPINLTYGERTGSCMRIKGVGYDLYNLCKSNENAFHIRLTDKETGEFISRVSGFRSGNSIFLNELRYSTIPKYTSIELIEAIKKTANMLISQSTNSEYPIDNVFITPLYAMCDQDKDTIKLKENMKDIKADLPNFWFDLNQEAIVLATTSKIEEYVPIKKDVINLPKYKTLRDKPKEYTKQVEIFEQINKINILSEMLQKDDTSMLFKTKILNEEDLENIIYVISGEDWYISLDNNMNTKEFIIPRNDNRAVEEFLIAKEIINKKKEEYYNNATRNR